MAADHPAATPQELRIRWSTALRASPRLTIAETGSDVHEAAWEWLARHDEREYSFVAVSFEVMRRRRLTDVLALDDDFSRALFNELRPR